MEHPTVSIVPDQITISFEALQQAIAKLDLEAKCDLLEWLELLVVDEEAALETDEDRAAIAEARAAYEAGDYVTLDEYLAEQRDNEE